MNINIMDLDCPRGKSSDPETVLLYRVHVHFDGKPEKNHDKSSI